MFGIDYENKSVESVQSLHQKRPKKAQGFPTTKWVQLVLSQYSRNDYEWLYLQADTSYSVIRRLTLSFIQWRHYLSNRSGTRSNAVETRIKEPIFTRTSRLKFNILNPLDKNPSEADTTGGSSTTGFMSSESLRTFKNSWHSGQNSTMVQKNIRFLTIILNQKCSL